MPNPGSFPFAELLSSLGSLVVVIMVGAVLLILWQVAILLGALIASLRHSSRGGNGGQLRVG